MIILDEGKTFFCFYSHVVYEIMMRNNIDIIAEEITIDNIENEI